MERGGVQATQLIVQIILARLLSPDDYGVLALITVFIAIANIFVQSGFSSALVQKKEADETDYSSVFYSSLAFSAIIYTLLFFTAPLIADFYNETILVLILRIQALTLFLGTVNSVQYAILTKRMQFKKSFIASTGGVVISAAVGISMAYGGYGVWALVWMQIVNIVTATVILWFLVSWRPCLLFSVERLKSICGFSSKLLVSDIIDVVFNNIYSLIIGKMYNKNMLGYYNRGQQIPNTVVININGPITGVMFPTIAAIQNDLESVKGMTRRSVITSCFIVFPLMAALAAVSRPLTIILLTEKWLPSVPFMQLSCLLYAFYPMHTANLQAISAIGRSDIFLKLEIIKKIVLIIIIAFSAPLGIYAMISGSAVASIIFTVINAYPNKRIMNYGFKEQWIDIIPSLVLSLTMGIIMYLLQFINLNEWVTLGIQGIFGIVYYFTMAYVLKFECFMYLINVIKVTLKSRTAPYTP